MSSLTGKVAIVTASSRGIGRSIAQRLGKDGAAVAVNYVASPEKAEAVVKEIIANGGRAIAIQGSVANKADVTRLFDETERQLGSIDIVVNVAGLILDREVIDHLIGQTPLGRLGKPQDIADVVAFLVGDDAHWMTGQNLQVNGGIL
jgi:NAD(P)-dependent dehydrogenase (short-subunit alcohol dehydrogenase family)